MSGMSPLEDMHGIRYPFSSVDLDSGRARVQGSEGVHACSKLALQFACGWSVVPSTYKPKTITF
jgi:hypothetical protein